MSIQYTSKVVLKGIWRDMINYFRYKAFFFGWIVEIFSLTLGFLILGSAYHFTPAVFYSTGLSEDAVFLFLMTGSAVHVFSGVATWGPLFRVEEDIHFGTLEAIFVTPSTRIGYLLSTTISRALFSFIFFIPFYIVALVLAGQLTNPKVIGFTLLIALITVISLNSIGLFFGMLAILYRQTRLLVTVLGQLVQFLCGAYIPVQAYTSIHPVIGTGLKYFAMLFPFTYNFDLMRYFMLEGFITLLPVWGEFLVLLGCTVMYLILARILLISVEKKAKKEGLSKL